MKTEGVPARVVEWARAQSAEFGWEELSGKLGISQRSALLYLSRLARNGLVSRSRKGRYRSFETRHSGRIKKVASILSAQLPLTGAILWSTDQLVHLTDNIPQRAFLFVETAPENVYAIADALRRNGMRAVGKPSARDLAESLERDTDVFVIARRDRCGAIRWKGAIQAAALERVLLGTYFLVTRKGLPYPEEEIRSAIRMAVLEKAVDARTLRRCAGRRNLLPELEGILEDRP